MSLFSKVISGVKNVISNVKSKALSAAASPIQSGSLGSVLARPSEVAKGGSLYGSSNAVVPTGSSVSTGNIQQALQQQQQTGQSYELNQTPTQATQATPVETGTTSDRATGKDRSTIQKVGDFLGVGTGNNIVNPFSGKVVVEDVQMGTLPLGPSAGANVVKGIGSIDDFLSASKAASSLKIATGASKIINPMEQAGASILNGASVGGAQAAATGVVGTTKVGTAVANSANAAKAGAFIKNFVKSKGFKYTSMIAGAASWLFTGSFGFNELNDDILSLSFKAGDATKNGDFELAQDLNNRMEELDRLNKWTSVLGGPIFYIWAAISKGNDTVESTQTVIDKAEQKEAENTAMEAKIYSGRATQGEIAEYVDDNPYSEIAIVYNQNLKNLAYGQEGTNFNTALQNVLAGSQGMVAEQAQEEYVPDVYEAPSSLNFGILHTSGYYRAQGITAPDDAPESLSTSDMDELSQYLYGVAYSKLTDTQKAVIGKW